MQNIEYKSIQFKAENIRRDGDYLFVDAYAAVFGNEDTYRDILVKGAFLQSISGDNAARVKLCYQHDIRDVRGKIVDLKEDETGLFVTFRTSRTLKGKDMAIQIEDGELFELSIGYITKDSEQIGDIRFLKEVELIEVSIVSRAANPLAVIISTERKDELVAGIKSLSNNDLTSLFHQVKSEYYSRIYNLLS